MFAYILINLVDKHEQNILEELQNEPEVLDSHILFGEWDLIVKIKVEHIEEVSAFVMKKLRGHQDVNLTSTLIVAK